MESLGTSILETRSVFDLQNDLNLIDAINNKLNQLDTLRNQNLDSYNDKLQEQRRQLENILSGIKELKSSTRLKSTKTELMRFENELFETARSLTSLNMELNSSKLSYNQDLKKLDELDNELEQLKSKPLSNDEDNPENIEKDPGVVSERAKIIKLKLYESLGLKLNFDKKDVLILNKSQNKVSVLKIDDTYSEYFITNYIWDSL